MWVIMIYITLLVYAFIRLAYRTIINILYKDVADEIVKKHSFSVSYITYTLMFNERYIYAYYIISLAEWISEIVHVVLSTIYIWKFYTNTFTFIDIYFIPHGIIVLFHVSLIILIVFIEFAMKSIHSSLPVMKGKKLSESDSFFVKSSKKEND